MIAALVCLSSLQIKCLLNQNESITWLRMRSFLVDTITIGNASIVLYSEKILAFQMTAIYTKFKETKVPSRIPGGRREGSPPSPPCICDSSTYTKVYDVKGVF